MEREDKLKALDAANMEATPKQIPDSQHTILYLEVFLCVEL